MWFWIVYSKPCFVPTEQGFFAFAAIAARIVTRELLRGTYFTGAEA
jgi:hypothetical protein